MSNLESLKQKLKQPKYFRIYYNILNKRGFKDEEIYLGYIKAESNAKDLQKSEKLNFLKKGDLISPEEELWLEDLCSEESIWKNVETSIISSKTHTSQINQKEVPSLTQEDLSDIKQRTASQRAVHNLDKRFVLAFDRTSANNEVLGECLFYSLIGIMCRNIEIPYESNRHLDPRLHLFVIQDSGTGKDRALDFMETIIKKINFYNEAEHDVPLIRYINISGTESTESFLNHFAVTAKGKVSDHMTMGILAAYDLILMRECSFLFQKGNNNAIQSKREVFLQVMEGRKIERTLIKYDGKVAETQSNATIIGMSRPIENMEEHLGNTGLQQRALNYMHRVTIEERKKMLKKILKYKNLTEEDIKLHQQEVSRLAKELYDLYNFIKNNTFSIIERDKVNEFVYDRHVEYLDYIEENSSYDLHKRVGSTFVSRFIDPCHILARYNAAIRKSKTVEFTDYERAFEFIDKLFKSLFSWSEDTLQVSYREERKYQNWHKTFTKAFNKPFMDKKELIQRLQMLGGFKQAMSYKIINHFKNKLYNENKDKILVWVDKERKW